MAVIKKIAVHNTGGIGDNKLAPSSHLTLEQINKAHKARDFNLSEMGYYVGYNFSLFPSGEIKQTRLIGEETAGAKGSNFDTVHICLLGNFEQGSGESPTFDQKMNLKALLSALVDNRPERLGLKVKRGTILDITKDRIVPHRVLQMSTGCYGSSLKDSWAKDLIISPSEEAEKKRVLITLISLYQKLLELIKQQKKLRGSLTDCANEDVRG